MQRLSLQVFHRAFLRAINRIAKQRMPDTCHMDTNLMRPAGFQLAFNIRIISKAFQHTVMCDRRFSVPFINRHLFPVCRMAADCTAHGSLVLFQIPMDNCPVLSGNGMYRELFCEALVGEIALTDNQGTRCVHIDSVDDSGAQNAVDAGEISAAVIQNRIDQSFRCCGLPPDVRPSPLAY